MCYFIGYYLFHGTVQLREYRWQTYIRNVVKYVRNVLLFATDMSKKMENKIKLWY